MNNKTVMIFAYCNFNLGDDLFIEVLCKRYPKTQFLLYAQEKYKMKFKNYSNIKVYSSDKVLHRILRFLLRKFRINYSIRDFISKKADAIVHIGGSIFMQKGNQKYYNPKKMISLKKPYYVIGANFGPYSDEQYYHYHHKLFQRYKDICFRDNYSFELFKDLKNVRKAADVVFQLKKTNTSENEKKIVISVIKPSYRNNLIKYDEIYFQKIKEASVYLAQKGYEIVLMSFCENEGDKEAIIEIYNMIPEEYRGKVKKYYYKLDMDEALNIIQTSEYVIATRFHAMILGWVYSKPVFPIPYSKKMNNVMKDIGYEGYYNDLTKISSLNLEQVYKGINENVVNVSNQIKDAEKQFEELDKFLF